MYRNWIVLILVSLGISSCAHAPNEEHVPTVNNSREIASLAPSCVIEKHPTDDFWRLKINGTPFNQHWYSEEEAEKMKVRLTSKGMCP